MKSRQRVGATAVAIDRGQFTTEERFLHWLEMDEQTLETAVKQGTADATLRKISIQTCANTA